jgi:hypothetical protein
LPTAVACEGIRAYYPGMFVYFDIGDRARLRERFFGAAHSVLARL